MVPFDFPKPGGSPEVVFEDDDLVVVRKPSGMHTSGASTPEGVPSETTLLSWTLERYPEIGRVSGRGRREGGLLHRLDRETTGLVLFARNEAAFGALSAAAGNGLFRKEYVLRAIPSPDELSGCRPGRVVPEGVDAGKWTAALVPGGSGRLADLIRQGREEGRDVAVEGVFRAYGPGASRVACAASGTDLGKRKREWGRIAYRTAVLEAVSPDARDTVEIRVSLTRGFRHQIRAHLAWAGLPLRGDLLYGGESAERLFLHAAALEFPHPRTGRAIVVTG